CEGDAPHCEGAGARPSWPPLAFRGNDPMLPPGVRPRPSRQQQRSVRRARFAPHRGLPMPWESGPRGRPYYTRTRRENGRVIREYVGVGQEGQRAAEEDEARRRQVEAERATDRSLAEDIRTLNQLAELLARAALPVAGY